MIRLIPRLAALLALAGCAATGIAGDPITRTFQWGDVMAGNDIRRSCGPGAPERLRFIYNGNYAEQVRVYEIEAVGLDTRIFDRPNLAHLGTLEFDQFMRGAAIRTPITQADLRQIVGVWESDLPRAVRPGDHLRSDRFFWTTAGCRDGRFVVAAFNYPADASTPFAFPGELARFDRSGRPFNPPRPIARDAGVLADFTPKRHDRSSADGARFLLKVTEDGIQQGY